MKKGIFLYLAIIAIFSFLIWNSISETNPLVNAPEKGFSLVTPSDDNHSSISGNPDNHSEHLISVVNNILKKIEHPISILLLQIIVIIIFSRLMGRLFGKIGQPTVIGEILSGIILGPSLVGYYFPEFSNFLFPDSSMDKLEIFSQIGLVLFMFVIGMELDLRILKQKIKTSIFISHISILTAFFTGTILAGILYTEFSLGTNFKAFALFIGISMSIAAFPVLARIVQEKGMMKTSLGKNIITIAAIDDLTAWCLLAVIIALIQAGNIIEAFITIALTLLYITLMFAVAQPLMKKIGSIYITKEIVNKKIVALVFILIFVSACFTEIIGIKALFGGFLAGVIMPQSQRFKKIMSEKIEDFSLVVLLPLFFVYTGLRTEIGLINQSSLWITCFMIIGFAIVGKLGSSFIAAKISGQSWKNSIIIGTLMNTRGLMELIVLNIGYDIGILTPQIFTMMVIMTLVTTFMTGPLLWLIEKFQGKAKNILPSQSHTLKFFLAFGMPSTGSGLLRLTSYFMPSSVKEDAITALHMTPHTEISHTDALKYEELSFAPIKKTAKELNLPIKTIYKTSEDVSREIINTVNKKGCDILIIGSAKSVFNKNIVGGRVKAIIKQSKTNVGVYIDKQPDAIKKTLVLSDFDSLSNMSGFVFQMLKNSDSEIHFASTMKIADNYPDLASYISKKNDRLFFSELILNSSEYFNAFDLIIVNARFFEKTFSQNQFLSESTASLLIINFSNDIFSELYTNTIQ